MKEVKERTLSTNLEFTEEQRRVVYHEEGPALVLAVPGAGKTTTLLARTARLIVERGVEPERIMTVTFSRESARDLRSRFESRFNLDQLEGLKKAKFSTIHSMAYSIIREEYPQMNVDGVSVFTDFLKEEGITLDEDDNLGVVRLYDFLSEEGLSAKQLSEDDLRFYLKFNCVNITQLMVKYEKYKSKNNYINFNDQLIYCLDILKDKKRRVKYQAKYDFIQVDEYQDVSKIQYDIIKLLTGTNGNLLCIGDIDQSIMSFRGVDINSLLGFTKDFKKAEVFNMSANFRSAPEIVNVASSVISRNKKRVEVSMVAEQSCLGKIDVTPIEDISEIAEYITARLRDIEGTSAVLFRNKDESVVLMSELIKNSVPFYYKEDHLKFLELDMVSEIISLLRLSINPREYDYYFDVREATGKRIVPYDWHDDESEDEDSPSKKIFEWDLEKLVYGDEKVYDKDIEFFMRVLELGKVPAEKCIDFIFDKIDFGRTFRYNITRTGMKKAREKLKAITRDCNSIAEIIERIEGIKESIRLLPCNEDKARITLSTIHSSKGLEWDNVFIIGEKNHFYDENRPYENISDHVEEERRLFYVAITRAKKKLEIVGVNCYSKELSEVNKEVYKASEDKTVIVKYNEPALDPVNIGDRFIHTKYGECTIIDINRKDDMLEAEFTDGTKKKFVLDTLRNNIMSRII